MGEGAKYPKREPFFAQRFIRLLAKTCAAQEIGVDAAWLLTVIATQEDAKRYTREVTYYNEQLMQILSFTRWHRLDKARKVAVASGWLHYEEPPKGARGVPGRYWVTVPDWAKRIRDGGCDEGEASTEGVDGRTPNDSEQLTTPSVDSRTCESEQPSTESVYQPVDGCVDTRVDGCVDGCVELPNLALCPNPNPKKKRRALRFDDADRKTAQWMLDQLLIVRPNMTLPNLDGWANTVRKLRELDGKTDVEIRDLWRRVQRDKFWGVIGKGNCLSPETLREKWDRLDLATQSRIASTPGVTHDPIAKQRNPDHGRM